MPSWGMHVLLAKKANLYLKMDLQELILGSVLPDINVGYVITPVSKKISGIITHFRDTNQNIDVSAFLKQYGNYLDQPIVMGYYLHLLLDRYWDQVVSKQYDLEESALRKHHDFWVLESLLLLQNHFQIHFTSNHFTDKIKMFSVLSLTKEDIDKTICFLNSLKGQVVTDEFLLFTREEYFQYYEQSMIEIIKQLKLPHHI